MLPNPQKPEAGAVVLPDDVLVSLCVMQSRTNVLLARLADRLDHRPPGTMGPLEHAAIVDASAVEKWAGQILGDRLFPG